MIDEPNKRVYTPTHIHNPHIHTNKQANKHCIYIYMCCVYIPRGSIVAGQHGQRCVWGGVSRCICNTQTICSQLSTLPYIRKMVCWDSKVKMNNKGGVRRKEGLMVVVNALDYCSFIFITYIYLYT